MKQARAFCFTLNNYTDEEFFWFTERFERESDSGDMQYLLIGFEKGKKGTPHMQGYMYFSRKESVRHLHVHHKVPKRAHIEIAKGNFEQNFKYCTKDGDFLEYGKRPDRKTSWQKIEEAINNPRDNPHVYNQFRKSYKEILRLDNKDKPKSLYIMPEKLYIKFLLTYKGQSICTSVDAYDGEDILIHPYFDLQSSSHFPVVEWFTDTLKKRRGYEVIPINPPTVIILFKGNTQAENLNEQCSQFLTGYIDIDNLENYTQEKLE